MDRRNQMFSFSWPPHEKKKLEEIFKSRASGPSGGVSTGKYEEHYSSIADSDVFPLRTSSGNRHSLWKFAHFWTPLPGLSSEAESGIPNSVAQILQEARCRWMGWSRVFSGWISRFREKQIRFRRKVFFFGGARTSHHRRLYPLLLGIHFEPAQSKGREPGEIETAVEELSRQPFHATRT